MSKVIDLQPRKHIYMLDHCAGCGTTSLDVYTEIGLPSPDNKEIKHIALCGRCSGVAKEKGVI